MEHIHAHGIFLQPYNILKLLKMLGNFIMHRNVSKIILVCT